MFSKKKEENDKHVTVKAKFVHYHPNYNASCITMQIAIQSEKCKYFQHTG